MPDEIKTLLIFVLACWPAQLLALVLHELGHAVAGYFAGFHVFAAGIGVGRPRWHSCLRGISVYFGRPQSIGLTLGGYPGFREHRNAVLWFILGGPLASIVGLCGGLLICDYDHPSAILLAWIVVSAVLALSSAIPYTVQRGGVRLANDARVLVDLARYGSIRIPSSGHHLTSMLALAELLSELGHQTGAAYFRMVASLSQIALGDFASANVSLDGCGASNLDDGLAMSAIVNYARAMIAVEENAPDADERLDALPSQMPQTADAEFHLDILRQTHRQLLGIDVSAELEALHHRAINASRRDWLCMVAKLELASVPFEQVAEKCDALLHTYQHYLTDADQARVLAMTTQRLAAGGSPELARAFFERAQRAIVRAGATIKDPVTRQAFLRLVTRPLEQAAEAASSEIPLFIPAIPDGPATDPITRKAIFTGVTVGFGIGAAFSAVGLVYFTDRPVADLCMMGFATYLLLGLVTSMIAVLRRERRWVLLSCAWTLIALAMAILAIVGPPTRPS